MKLWTYLFIISLVGCFIIAQAPPNADPESAEAAAKTAQQNAIQKLGDIVQAVRINSQLRVRDVVYSDPQIRGEFISFLQGATQVGNTVYRLDGICEVTVETNLDAIAYWLRTMTYKYTTTYDRRGIDDIGQFNPQKNFRATGMSKYRINSQLPPTKPVKPWAPPPVGHIPTRPDNAPSTIPEPPVMPIPQPPITTIPEPPVTPIPQPPVTTIPEPPTTQTIPQPPTSTPWEQPDFWSRVTPQGKGMARRAAQLDAYRNLGEQLQGVRIDSSTTVKDFITTSDEIRADFQGFVRGAQFISEQYRPDGIVEVTAQIDLNHFIKHLQKSSRKYSRDYRWNRNRFEGIRQYQQYPIITAKGNGTVPNSMINTDTPILQPTPTFDNPDTFNTIPDPPRPDMIHIPEWVQQSVKFTGIGICRPDMVVAQAKVFAREDAEIEAYRQLVEHIYGLRLDPQMKIQDFLTTHANVDQQLREVIGSAKITETRDMEDSIEVDVELQLEKIWQVIEPDYLGEQSGTNTEYDDED